MICHRQSHLVAAAVVTRGPSPDYCEFEPVLTQADSCLHFDRVLADAGYDSEKNHQFAREKLKIRSTVIPAASRQHQKSLPAGKYRRQMRIRFHHQVYKMRAHVECVFSRIKRLLGPCLRSKLWQSQQRECLLRILTFNLMLLAGAETA